MESLSIKHISVPTAKCAPQTTHLFFFNYVLSVVNKVLVALLETQPTDFLNYIYAKDQADKILYF